MKPAKLAGALAAGLVALGALAAGAAMAQSTRGHGVFDFVRPINPDPVLQHAKEVYVLNGCAYCHGLDLSVQNGEAADLYSSALVAADRDGDRLIPLLRKGIPQTPKLSPMPQFADLSDGEMTAIVRWVHYARQERRFADLSHATLPAGAAASGQSYFAANCAACHTAGQAFGALRAKPAELTRQILRPDFVTAPRNLSVASGAGAAREEARARHLQLLERYSPEVVANLAAYIRAW